MIGCLLTSQQRAAPNSPVTRFLLTKPFPLRLELCREESHLESFVTETLKAFGGIRFSTRIGVFARANLNYLNEDGWIPTFNVFETVRLHSNPETERQAARYIDKHFRGFGPKQSRNLVQGLGLSRFEVPIDSRITKWLNELPFAITLAAEGLNDPNYYEFVSDGFQKLAEAAEMFPCVLDAVIFSSPDKGQWTDENAVW